MPRFGGIPVEEEQIAKPRFGGIPVEEEPIAMVNRRFSGEPVEEPPPEPQFGAFKTGLPPEPVEAAPPTPTPSAPSDPAMAGAAEMKALGIDTPIPVGTSNKSLADIAKVGISSVRNFISSFPGIMAQNFSDPSDEVGFLERQAKKIKEFQGMSEEQKKAMPSRERKMMEKKIKLWPETKKKIASKVRRSAEIAESAKRVETFIKGDDTEVQKIIEEAGNYLADDGLKGLAKKAIKEPGKVIESALINISSQTGYLLAAAGGAVTGVPAFIGEAYRRFGKDAEELAKANDIVIDQDIINDASARFSVPMATGNFVGTALQLGGGKVVPNAIKKKVAQGMAKGIASLLGLVGSTGFEIAQEIAEMGGQNFINAKMLTQQMERLDKNSPEYAKIKMLRDQLIEDRWKGAKKTAILTLLSAAPISTASYGPKAVKGATEAVTEISDVARTQQIADIEQQAEQVTREQEAVKQVQEEDKVKVEEVKGQETKIESEEKAKQEKKKPTFPERLSEIEKQRNISKETVVKDIETKISDKKKQIKAAKGMKEKRKLAREVKELQKEKANVIDEASNALVSEISKEIENVKKNGDLEQAEGLLEAISAERKRTDIIRNQTEEKALKDLFEKANSTRLEIEAKQAEQKAVKQAQEENAGAEDAKILDARKQTNSYTEEEYSKLSNEEKRQLREDRSKLLSSEKTDSKLNPGQRIGELFTVNINEKGSKEANDKTIVDYFSGMPIGTKISVEGMGTYTLTERTVGKNDSRDIVFEPENQEAGPIRLSKFASGRIKGTELLYEAELSSIGNDNKTKQAVVEKVAKASGEAVKEIKQQKINRDKRKVISIGEDQRRARVSLGDLEKRIIEAGKKADPNFDPEEPSVKPFISAFADVAGRHTVTDLPSTPHRNSKIDEFKNDKDKTKQTVFVFLDLNEFKRINDTYGQEGGDQVMIDIMHSLNEQAAKRDINHYHEGGDEGSMLFRVPKKEAKKFLNYVAEIKKSADQFIISGKKGDAPIGISFGVSTESVNHADQLAKNAKKQGVKNSVIFDDKLKKIYNVNDIIGEDVGPIYDKLGFAKGRGNATEQTDVQVQGKTGKQSVETGKGSGQDARTGRKETGRRGSTVSKGQEVKPKTLVDNGKRQRQKTGDTGDGDGTIRPQGNEKPQQGSKGRGETAPKRSQESKPTGEIEQKPALKVETKQEQKPAPVDETPTLNEGDKKAAPKTKKRRRGFGNPQGSLGFQKQQKITDTKTEKTTEKTTEKPTEKTTVDPKLAKAEKEFDRQDKKVREAQKKKFSWRNLYNQLGRRFWQNEKPIASALSKSEEGKTAVARLQDSRGSSAMAADQIKTADKDIYSTVNHDQEEMFNRYLEAKRIIEVNEIKGMKGGEEIEVGDNIFDKTPEENIIKSPISLESAQAYVDAIENNPNLAGIVEAGNKYWGWMEKLLDESHANGLISTELRDYLKENHKHYSPRKFLQYIDPQNIQFDVGGNKVSVPESGIKALDEGSENALINDARYLLEQHIARHYSRTFKNDANKAMADWIRSNPKNELGITLQEPEMETVEYKLPGKEGTVTTKEEVVKTDEYGNPAYGKTPEGMTRFFAREKGKPVSILMPDEIAKSWSTYDPQVSSTLAKFVKAITFTPVLKAGATGYNPAFALANTPRDIIFTWFKQHDQYSSHIPIALGQIAKDMKEVTRDVIGRKGIYKEFIKYGGGMELLTSQGQFLKRKLGEPKSATREAAEQAQEILGWFGTTSELYTRLALMHRARKNLIKKGMSYEKATQEAAHIARSNIDFAQGGSITKALDNAIPYFGAGVQGTRGLVQAFKNNPKLATYKAAQVMAISFATAYWSSAKDDEGYEKMSDREKVTRWNIPLFKFKDKDTGETRHSYLSIPKDHGQQLFAAIGEAMADWAHGKEFNSNRIWMAVESALPIDMLTKIPPSLGAFLSYALNKDLWSTQKVWRGRKVSPENEKYWDTPKFYQIAGEALGMSPVRLEAASQRIWPKNMFTEAFLLPWEMNSKTMPENDKLEVNGSMMSRALSSSNRWPMVRRLLRTTWPDRSDQMEMFKKVNELGIDTHRKDGSKIPTGIVKRKIKEAELKRNDIRQINDNELKRLFYQYALSGQKDDTKIKDFFKKTAKEHPKDVKRLVTKYKLMLKKVTTNEKMRDNIRRISK